MSPILEFSATIQIIGVNPYVLVSAAQDASLQPNWRKPLPVAVQVNGQPKQPWHINLMPIGDGNFYLYVHGDVRQASRTAVGDRVNVRLWFDVDYKNGPTHPLPDQFSAELIKSQLALAHWQALPPSRQKEVLRYFAMLKSEAALERNIAQALVALKGGPTHFMGRDWNHGK